MPFPPDRMSEQKQNMWQHGPTEFEIPALDEFFGPRDGLMPMPVILDPAGGGSGPVCA